MYETRKRSDLVAIDDAGRIVVIEIKRDIAKPMDEFQAFDTHPHICIQPMRKFADYIHNT
jgi:hypothetical protein